ncbi:MAG: DEAD/DEAH box helicase [Spirochaetales bacterium]|nr:DEAD/DEAH box helicase [Spirochaetales bacterium]
MTTPLSPITQHWFTTHVGSPTPIQTQTWPKVASGHHVLAVAPTGSGKTLAAFMVALDQLFNSSKDFGQADPSGPQILYISPLKALGTDVKENLAAPLRGLKEAYAQNGIHRDIRIGVRNGDTSPSERRRQFTKPPHILVTTPESLGILLLSENGRRLLSKVRTCILDEIHAIAPTRRGTLLSVALERLTTLAGEFQRLGLTATVNPLEKAASYLGGFFPAEQDFAPRPVHIIRPQEAKKIQIIVEDIGQPPAPNQEADQSWRDLAQRLKKQAQGKRATLAFIDSRKWAEKLARFMNEGEEEPFAWAHHGSLSKDMRRLVEGRLKKGEIKTVVATGSLELGIDVGPLDEAALIGTPSSPSTLLQRAGRAGHQPGETSVARIFPITPSDLLAATALAKMAQEGEIEELLIPENPLDMAAQSLLALCVEHPRSPQELYELLRQSWSFHRLPQQDFDNVLAMLQGRYAGTRLNALRPQLYKDEQKLVARPGTRLRLYAGGGAIPDLGMYNVREQGSDTVIGVLDEKFVWESQIGAVFALGNRRWRMANIDEKQVTVVPTNSPETTEAFWRAEGASRSPQAAQCIGLFLEQASQCLSQNPEHLPQLLMQDWNLNAEAAAHLSDYLQSQERRSGTALPHHHRIVAEVATDPRIGHDPESRSLFLHLPFGARVNRPLALALQASWQSKGASCSVPSITDDAVVFTVAQRDAQDFIHQLYTLTNPEKLLRQSLESTPFFGGRFREVAGRAQLLPASTPRKRQPLWMTRQRARALMEATAPYPDFPLFAEVWRSCLQDDFAMEHLGMLLAGIQEGQIDVVVTHTPAPSPFSNSVVRRRLGERMTSNMQDQGEVRFSSALDSQEIQRLVGASALRPRIPSTLSTRLHQRRQRLETGYAPKSPEALAAWVAEREAFSHTEWTALFDATLKESGCTRKKMDASHLLKAISLGPNKAPWYIIPEAQEEWQSAFQTNENQQLLHPTEAANLLAFWIRGRGPQPLSTILRTFGLPESQALPLQEALESLPGESIIVDALSEDSQEHEVLDAEGLEILLRWRRRSNRNTDAPLPSHRLAPFLAHRQNLDCPQGGWEGLGQALSILEGLPHNAQSWETSLLPSRVQGYQPRDLDGMVKEERLTWIGAPGKTVLFLTDEGGWRFPSPPPIPNTTGVFPSPSDGELSFWEMAERLQTDSAQTSQALWEQVWTGHLTCGDMDVLRKAAAAGFRTPKITKGQPPRGGLRGWRAGRPISSAWYAPSFAQEPEDALEQDQLSRERIRLLLRRWGVLTRPLLEREIPPWHWNQLERTLHLMELSDELLGGRWFEDLPMPQFLSPDALPLWRSGAIPGGSWVMEATDPASPCGIPGIKAPTARREGHWLAWDGDGCWCCTVKVGSKALETPEPIPKNLGPALRHLVTRLTERSVAPLPRVSIQKWNGQSTDGVAKHLEEAGFHPTGNDRWVAHPRPIGLR